MDSQGCWVSWFSICPLLPGKRQQQGRWIRTTCSLQMMIGPSLQTRALPPGSCRTVNVVSLPAILFRLPTHPFSPPLLLDAVSVFPLGFSRSFLVLQLPKSDPTSVLCCRETSSRCLRRSKGIRSPKTGVVGGCEPPRGYRGPSPGTLWDQLCC